MKKTSGLTSTHGEHAENRLRIQEGLSQQNYYIVVPPALITNEFVQKALKATGLKYADFEKLHLIASAKVLQNLDKWQPVVPDYTLLSLGNPQEEKRMEIAVSKRKMLIQEGFRKETTFSLTDGSLQIQYRAKNVTTEAFSENHVALAKFLARLTLVKGLEWDWINQLAVTEGGILVAGSTPQKVDSTLFRILNPEFPTSIDETNDAFLQELIKKQSFWLLRTAIITINSEHKIASEQKKIQIERTAFQWADNPLITRVRDLARSSITETCKAFSAEGVTEFDIATQLMMHLPTYDAIEVWQGNIDLVREIEQHIALEKGDKATILFEEALSTGKFSLNMDLVSSECLRQGAKLAEYYKHLSLVDDGRIIRLPAKYMGTPEQNPFIGVARAEIDARKRQMKVDSVTGEKTMEAIERHSGRIIVFKKISAEISKLYSLGFSNLHYARDGEIAAYGAFLEGDEFPFAYSSYSPVTRKYTKNMLRHLHLDPTTILESTRAWNASWSPENTMSTLFSFCHEMLKEDRIKEMTVDPSKRALIGVITSINPNLGFKAVSFRGVRFNVAGIKPTQFSYLKNSDGTANFLPKNVIQAMLNMSADELENDPRFLTNKIPFLPTLELLALFEKNKEEELLQSPIYRISESAFRKG
ncbi:MAG TPA: hypothetical protein VLG12_03870 [Candidatus Saccharimonadales bacterium]|nr:hypothetical protein [Candidatus Saccharimonadales bacterium]